MAVDYDPAIIGRVFETTDPLPVTAEMVANFCSAIGESNPLHTDADAARRGPYGSLTAPPSFAVTFRNGQHFFQHVPRYGKQGFDAGKDVEFVAPIHPGDASSLASHVKAIYEQTGRTGSMVFVIVRTTLTNQKGEVVAHVDHRFMNRT